MTKYTAMAMMYGALANSINSPVDNSYKGIKNGLYVDTFGKIDLIHKLSKRQKRKLKAVNKKRLKDKTQR